MIPLDQVRLISLASLPLLAYRRLCRQVSLPPHTSGTATQGIPRTKVRLLTSTMPKSRNSGRLVPFLSSPSFDFADHDQHTGRKRRSRWIPPLSPNLRRPNTPIPRFLLPPLRRTPHLPVPLCYRPGSRTNRSQGGVDYEAVDAARCRAVAVDAESRHEGLYGSGAEATDSGALPCYSTAGSTTSRSRGGGRQAGHTQLLLPTLSASRSSRNGRLEELDEGAGEADVPQGDAVEGS